MWPILVLAAIGATWYVATKQNQQPQSPPPPAPNPVLPNLPGNVVPAVIPGPAGPIPVPVVPVPPPGVIIPPGTPGSATPSGPLNMPNLSDVQTLPAPLQATWGPNGMVGGQVPVNISFLGGTTGFTATLLYILPDGVTGVLQTPAINGVSALPSVGGINLPSKFYATKATS